MKAKELIDKAESVLALDYKRIDGISLINTNKVLEAFREERIAVRHFTATNGYGYGDEGKESLAKVYARVFGAEQAIMSPALLSGTHAITVALFGVLRPDDRVLCITGTPYDTLRGVVYGKNNGSLADYKIGFDEIQSDENGRIDEVRIRQALVHNNYRMVYIQRSRGYELRDAYSVGEISDMCTLVRSCGFTGCIFVDNCYGEFVEETEPCAVGADLIAGSLIKNPGGGLAPTGGYIAGKKEFVVLCENRLTAPSVGCEVGSYAYGYQLFYQGLFMAPHAVAQAVKGSLLIGKCLEMLGYESFPKIGKMPADITRAIRFNTEEELTDFICSVQECSPIDSFVRPEAWDMPGYDCKVIMAAGTFVNGATSELSADAPIRKPYTAYFQGGLTYEHCRIACERILSKLLARRGENV